MRKADLAIWFLKFACTCVILLAGCWAAPRFFNHIPQFPPTTTDEQQIVVLNRYFQLPVRDVALVGSSLTFRLKEDYFERGDVRNVSLPGGSPLTGLALIEAAPARRPHVLAVETNILTRGIDYDLFEKFKRSNQPDDILRPLRTLAAFYQRGLDNRQATFDPARRRAALERPAIAQYNEKGLAQAIQDWNKPIYDATIMRDAKTLRSLVDKLEAEDVTVVLYELPLSQSLEETGYVKTTREILENVLGPHNNRWLNLEYPAEELRWEGDGAHLDERSAIIISAALDNAIRKKWQERAGIRH